MATKITTVLNNAKSTRAFGDGGKGTDLRMDPGATDLPTALFEQVLSGDDGQARALRASIDTGTLTVIDTAAPLEPSTIDSMKSDAVIRAANVHGDVETRARLSQRMWIMAGQPHLFDVPPGFRHLFEGSPATHAINEDPNDRISGWKAFARPQKHTDSTLAILASDAAATKAHAQRLADVAAVVNAKVGAK